MVKVDFLKKNSLPIVAKAETLTEGDSESAPIHFQQLTGWERREFQGEGIVIFVVLVAVPVLPVRFRHCGYHRKKYEETVRMVSIALIVYNLIDFCGELTFAHLMI